jgi:hypothetical protein
MVWFMTVQEFYPASLIKPKKTRATKSEMATRRRRLIEIIREDYPMTVRQLFYQAVVHAIVGKSADDYAKVADMITSLRRDGTVPFEWIVDEGRFPRKPYTVEGLVQALNTARFHHRKDPWQTIPAYVQIWVEKNALLGVLQPVTDEYDVPLMCAVGYSSLSFLHKTARQLNELKYPIHIYQFGDLDPSGADAAIVIERELKGFAPNAEIHFTRVAITPEQVVEFGLVPALRPSKTKDSRYRWFLNTYKDVDVIQGGRMSVELDAIRPNLLRDLVRGVIEKHLPRHVLDTANAAGEMEKARLGRMVDEFIEAENARRRTYLPLGSDHLGVVQAPW